MPEEVNPYESPSMEGTAELPYSVTSLRSLFRNRAVTLRETITQRAEDGWRLVSSWTPDSVAQYLIWKRAPAESGDRTRIPDVRVLPLPGVLECLRNRSFSPWTPAIAEQISELDHGWTFNSFCSFAGYVLNTEPITGGRQTGPVKYAVRKCPPVWWRTLFGNSWIPFLSDTLNGICDADTEIVGYLGNGSFLLRTRPSSAPAEFSHRPVRKRYQLVMWPSWKSILLPGIPKLAPWLSQQAANGWELISFYEGAVFLFASFDQPLVIRTPAG